MDARSRPGDEGSALLARGPGARAAPRAQLWPLLLAGIAALAVIITNLVDFGVDDLRSALLDASLDSSWSHLATAVILATGGLMTVLRALQPVAARAWWNVTAAALILLFIIEVSPVHVQVGRLSYGKLIYAPLLAALAVSVWHLAGSSDQTPLVRVGLSALVTSYVVHVFGSQVVEALGWGLSSWAYQVKVGLKEGTELAGWLLVVLALWRSGPPLVRTGHAMGDGVLAKRLGPASKLARWAVRDRAEPG